MLVNKNCLAIAVIFFFFHHLFLDVGLLECLTPYPPPHVDDDDGYVDDIVVLLGAEADDDDDVSAAMFSPSQSVVTAVLLMDGCGVLKA